MNSYFRRQLADYVEYHRDPWNCAFHVFGILSLFTGCVLPLSTWQVTAFGVHLTVAVAAALPVLIYWLLLDAVVGLAIAGAAALLLCLAASLANHASLVQTWSMTVTLIVAGIAFQVIGHQVFERRKPSLTDHPAHLLLGPMFVMAKLLIALGFRRDLAAIIAQAPQSSSQSGIAVRP
jgi:uncharacterized membrane protein YGL010W